MISKEGRDGSEIIFKTQEVVQGVTMVPGQVSWRVDVAKSRKEKSLKRREQFRGLVRSSILFKQLEL